MTDCEPPTEPSQGLDDDEQRDWQLFLESSVRMLATVNGSLRTTHGLTLVDTMMLDALARSERGAARVSVMAKALMLDHNRVARAARNLEKRGLVSRRPTRYDRRGMLVSITYLGRVELELAVKTYAQEVRTHYLDKMSRQQITDLAYIYRRISTPLLAGQLAGAAYLATQ